MARPLFAQRRNEIDPVIDGFLDYLKLEAGASDNTIRAYRADLSKWSEFCAQCGKPVYPVEDTTLSRYLHHLKTTGSAASTRMRRSAALSAFTKYLVYDGLLHETRSRIRIPKTETRLPMIMSEGEIDRLLESCDEARTKGASRKKAALGLRDRAMIETTYDCGLRASELCDLKLSDIDAAGGMMYVVGKGGKERALPFVGIVRKTVAEYVDTARPLLLQCNPAPENDAAYLFLSAGGRRMSRKELWRIVRKRGAMAGIARSRLHPHVLRHSFATHLQRRGMDVRTLQEMLGHSSIATTNKYAHLDTELRDIYDSFHPRSGIDQKH